MHGVTAEGKRFYLPITLLALALAALPLLRRRGQQEQPNPSARPQPIVDGPPPGPTPPLPPVVVAPPPEEVTPEVKPPEVTPPPAVEPPQVVAPVAEEPPAVEPPIVIPPAAAKEREGIVEVQPVPAAVDPQRERDLRHALVVDLEPNLDFYVGDREKPGILSSMWETRDALTRMSPERAHEAVAASVLDRWQANDIELGADPNDPWMDYRNNRHQIYWAGLHADHLIALHNARLAAEQAGQDVSQWNYRSDLHDLLARATVAEEREDRVEVAAPAGDGEIVADRNGAEQDHVTISGSGLAFELADEDGARPGTQADYSALSLKQAIEELHKRDGVIAALNGEVEELARNHRALSQRFEALERRLTPELETAGAVPHS